MHAFQLTVAERQSKAQYARQHQPRRRANVQGWMNSLPPYRGNVRLHTNSRLHANGCDCAECIAHDLVSDDKSPVYGGDKMLLAQLGKDALRKMRDTYLGARAAEGDALPADDDRLAAMTAGRRLYANLMTNGRAGGPPIHTNGARTTTAFSSDVVLRGNAEAMARARGTTINEIMGVAEGTGRLVLGQPREAVDHADERVRAMDPDQTIREVRAALKAQGRL